MSPLLPVMHALRLNKKTLHFTAGHSGEEETVSGENLKKPVAEYIVEEMLPIATFDTL